MNDRCKLFCKVSTSNAYYLLSDKVEDGTKCGPDTSDICVNGQCRVNLHLSTLHKCKVTSLYTS